MRVRAGDRNAESFSGEDVRGAGAAAEVGGAGGGEGAVGSLRATKAELEHVAAARGVHDARGFRRDERGEIQRVEQRRFDELRLKERAAHAHERLVREDDAAFRNCVDVAGESQRPQRIEKAALEESGAGEIREIVVGETEIAQVVDSRSESAGDREAGAERVAAKVKMEDGLAIERAALPIAGGHRQLIEVGEERARSHVYQSVGL